MPRTIRLQSESNIYHIVLKGINSCQLFFEASDYSFFLKEIRKASTAYGAQILAYCVMSNHVHLLMKFGRTDSMPPMFKSFGASFVPKYNYHHNRTGPVFNGRYYSSAVNDDAYLCMALRYIHFNPVKAGLCAAPQDYEWSSYRDYVGEGRGVCDTGLIREIISKEQFSELHRTDVDDFVNDYLMRSKFEKLNDEEIADLYNKLSGYAPEEVVRILKSANISKRKMERFLKIPRKYSNSN